jgi:hypothetical protein
MNRSQIHRMMDADRWLIFLLPFFNWTTYPEPNRHVHKRFRPLSNIRGIIRI